MHTHLPRKHIFSFLFICSHETDPNLEVFAHMLPNELSFYQRILLFYSSTVQPIVTVNPACTVFLDIGTVFGCPEPFRISGWHCIHSLTNYCNKLDVMKLPFFFVIISCCDVICFCSKGCTECVLIDT